jgi:NADH dehydrogenase
LLTWVIVGGGPTGAELAAELHDLARSKEFVKLYPNSAPKIKVKLMDAAPTILSNFDKSLSKYALKKFKREVSGILALVIYWFLY